MCSSAAVAGAVGMPQVCALSRGFNGTWQTGIRLRASVLRANWSGFGPVKYLSEKRRGVEDYSEAGPEVLFTPSCSHRPTPAASRTSQAGIMSHLAEPRRRRRRISYAGSTCAGLERAVRAIFEG